MCMLYSGRTFSFVDVNEGSSKSEIDDKMGDMCRPERWSRVARSSWAKPKQRFQHISGSGWCISMRINQFLDNLE